MGIRARVITAFYWRSLLLTLLLLSNESSAALRWHWDDGFTPDEQEKMSRWLTLTYQALERYAGTPPFDIELHLHRRDASREPVPWANTRRDGRQALHFYVDPTFTVNEFLSDWTAPHEFAHLLLPYLGRDNAWFAEGFASYLQHSVMVELGVIDAAEAERRRNLKIERALDDLDAETLPLPQNMFALRARGAYPTFYWGGAVYFVRVDEQLKAQGSSLQKVLQEFLQCCRMNRRSLDALAAKLDGLSSTELFTRELELMRSEPGCPERSVASVEGPRKSGP